MLTALRILLWPLRIPLLLVGLLIGVAGLGNILAGEWLAALPFIVVAGLCWEARRRLLPP